MSVIRASIAGLKPVIFVVWIVAALRLLFEARTTDLNFIAMCSTYAAIFVIFAFAGFTGALDALVWKPLLVGSVVLGIACFFLPNSISYSVAQFQGWNHGRFHVDPEHWPIQKRYIDQGMGFFEADEKATEELGREGTTRGPPPADTPAGKVMAGMKAGGITTIGGTLWSLVLGILFVGIPATVRRRRSPRA